MIFGNSGTPFLKVSAIYSNFDYYGLIPLTYFYTYYFPFGYHAQINFQNTKQETTQN